MPGATQAPVGGRALALRFFGRATLVSLFSLAAGCTTGVLDPGQPEIDRSLVTHSIPTAAPEGLSVPAIPGTSAVQAKLAAAMDGGGAALPLAWEDPDSGTRGMVTRVAAGKRDACRDFVTTRESFDGVSLYGGELCSDDAAGWQIRAFGPL